MLHNVPKPQTPYSWGPAHFCSQCVTAQCRLWARRDSLWQRPPGDPEAYSTGADSLPKGSLSSVGLAMA